VKGKGKTIIHSHSHREKGKQIVLGEGRSNRCNVFYRKEGFTLSFSSNGGVGTPTSSLGERTLGLGGGE